MREANDLDLALAILDAQPEVGESYSGSVYALSFVDDALPSRLILATTSTQIVAPILLTSQR